MGNIQHANAKTTPRIRKEIQESKESISELATRLSLNPNVHYIKNKNLFIGHKNFVDPLHLNNIGVELLSTQLSNILNKDGK